MTTALLSALGLLFALPAFAASDMNKFQKRIGKSAADVRSLHDKSDIVRKARGACLCSTLGNRPGLLLYSPDSPTSTGGVVYCQVYQFDADGKVFTNDLCFDFQVLPK